MLGYFKRETYKDVELVRMSNGDYCLVRPLGLVPGGKGMRYQENLLRLTPSGIASKLWSLAKLGVKFNFGKSPADAMAQDAAAVPVKISSQPSRASARG
ncbi:MAG: hypothetical protein JSR72_16735 [Proteobacteria bacterium]|nr:hypothetical protein [Pseudomonadota bacterium]